MDFDRLADVNTVKPALNWQYIYSYKNCNGYDNFDLSAVYQVFQELYHRDITYGMFLKIAVIWKRHSTAAFWNNLNRLKCSM